MQSTKGGGHGDFRLLVLAPASVQEAVDLVTLAFQLANKYRNPVMILGDGMIGQMMEPVEFKPLPAGADIAPKETWATCGAVCRKKNIVRSLFLDPEVLEQNNHALAAKYAQWQKDEIRFVTYNTEHNPKLLIVAYGTMARICSTAIDELKQEGIEVGLLRPITLYPFPTAAIAELGHKIGRVMTIEMSMGQMVEDVQAAMGNDMKVGFYGRAGGIVPSPDEVIRAIKANLQSKGEVMP
jgi:2-oxoglutarate ferredoxin oxidoreductase subunit alpha